MRVLFYVFTFILGFVFSYLIFSNNSNDFNNPHKQSVLTDQISNSNSSKKEKLVIEKYNLFDETHKNNTLKTLIDYPLYVLRNAIREKEEEIDKKSYNYSANVLFCGVLFFEIHRSL